MVPRGHVTQPAVIHTYAARRLCSHCAHIVNNPIRCHALCPVALIKESAAGPEPVGSLRELLAFAKEIIQKING